MSKDMIVYECAGEKEADLMCDWLDDQGFHSEYDGDEDEGYLIWVHGCEYEARIARHAIATEGMTKLEYLEMYHY